MALEHRIPALLLVALSAAALTGCGGKAPEQGALLPSQDDFYQELNTVGQLETAAMTVTKTITTERSAWYKVGKRLGVYSYDVYLKAYVDLSELREEDIDIDNERRTISLRMPEVRVKVSGRSPELREEYTHISPLRSRPDSKERAELKEKANSDFNRELKNNPAFVRELKSAGEKKAREFVRALGESRGYDVVFSDDLPVSIVE